MPALDPKTGLPARRRLRVRHVVLALLLLLLLLGTLTSGLSGFLVFAGLILLLVGAWSWTTGRRGLLRLPSRRAGAVTTGLALVALVVGGVVAPAPDDTADASRPASLVGSTSSADAKAERARDAAEEKAAAEKARKAEEAAAASAAEAKAKAEADAAAETARLEAERVAAEQAAAAQAEAARVAAEQAAAQQAAAAAAAAAAAQAEADRAAAARAPVAAAPSSTSFENCTAVRAAGRAPIYAGQPGYARHLDRDGDGVGCEN